MLGTLPYAPPQSHFVLVPYATHHRHKCIHRRMRMHCVCTSHMHLHSRLLFHPLADSDFISRASTGLSMTLQVLRIGRIAKRKDKRCGRAPGAQEEVDDSCTHLLTHSLTCAPNFRLLIRDFRSYSSISSPPGCSQACKRHVSATDVLPGAALGWWASVMAM